MEIACSIIAVAAVPRVAHLASVTGALQSLCRLAAAQYLTAKSVLPRVVRFFILLLSSPCRRQVLPLVPRVRAHPIRQNEMKPGVGVNSDES